MDDSTGDRRAEPPTLRWRTLVVWMVAALLMTAGWMAGSSRPIHVTFIVPPVTTTTTTAP